MTKLTIANNYFSAFTGKVNLGSYNFFMNKELQDNSPHESRRGFLKKTTAIAALAVASPALVKAGENDEHIASYFEKVSLQLEVNGHLHNLSVEPRVTLLDLLREQLALTGTKKGCECRRSRRSYDI